MLIHKLINFELHTTVLAWLAYSSAELGRVGQAGCIFFSFERIKLFYPPPLISYVVYVQPRPYPVPNEYSKTKAFKKLSYRNSLYLSLHLTWKSFFEIRSNCFSNIDAGVEIILVTKNMRNSKRKAAFNLDLNTFLYKLASLLGWDGLINLCSLPVKKSEKYPYTGH